MRLRLPAALWLLPLALLPLLALRRRPARRVPVATMHLWAAAAMREAAPLARRVRRHWLALLQVAIVGGHRAGRRGAAVAVARRTSAAVVVDTSLSMSARSGGSTRLALAGAARRGVGVGASGRDTRPADHHVAGTAPGRRVSGARRRARARAGRGCGRPMPVPRSTRPSISRGAPPRRRSGCWSSPTRRPPDGVGCRVDDGRRAGGQRRPRVAERAPSPTPTRSTPTCWRRCGISAPARRCPPRSRSSHDGAELVLAGR